MAAIRDFGAKGDGKTDDSQALQHALEKGDGRLVLPRGEYLITRPLTVPLDRLGRVAVTGQGGLAKIIMTGPGPAILLQGTHKKTAQPDHFAESVWQKERMPTIAGLEIEGRHAEADGVRVEGVMQPTLTGLLIRRCRHGIHLTVRNRNVVISDCHIYDNRGVGVFLDRVNLHQINIHGNHISYCKQGGIKVAGSEVRNIQICSNDIEYNYDLKTETSADVLFDSRAGTVREGTIVGNTIQANFSPNGANVRLLGVGRDNPNAVGLLAITGNLIGSQKTLVHLQASRGVVVSGNCLYSGEHHALFVEDSEHVVIGANCIDHNPEYKGKSTDQVVFRGCRNVSVTGLVLQHTRESAADVEESLLIRDCHNVSITGCQVLAARRRGIGVRGSAVVRIADCTIRRRPEDADYRNAIEVDEASAHVMAVNNFLARGNGGDLVLPDKAGTASGNVALT